MADFTWFFERGPLPLLVSMPHVGTQVPAALAARLTPAALTLADTDWHLPRLYDFLAGMGANLLVAINSRYVIDLNRDPAGGPLYPGADNTELCPLSTARHEPIYLPGQAPDASEVAERTATYWRPYHAKLAEALAEIKARHGYALLFDAHSIRSVLPRFFDGRLPDINLGSADDASADPSFGPALLATAGDFPAYTSVLNGRFKGGFITRHHGRPANHVHALQLELSWRTYMNEDGSFAFDDALAAGVRPALRAIVERYVALGAGLY
jgi:N-formylglutamate deformylase